MLKFLLSFCRFCVREWRILYNLLTISLLYLRLDQDEKYEHLEAAEVKKVEEAVSEKQKWLDEMWNKVNKQAPHEPPAVLTAAIFEEKQV